MLEMLAEVTPTAGGGIVGAAVALLGSALLYVLTQHFRGDRDQRVLDRETNKVVMELILTAKALMDIVRRGDA